MISNPFSQNPSEGICDYYLVFDGETKAES